MTLSGWLPWALLSALFAALTAIFAKVGIEAIESDFATLLRTVVVALTLGALVYATGKWQSPFAIPPKSALFLVLSARHRRVLDLLLPRAQGGRRLEGGAGRQAQ